MTDEEFWSVMAITVEQACSMPDYYPRLDGCHGLCPLVDSAFRCNLINRTQSERLLKQISLVRPKKFYDPFYWSPGSWRPRVRAMRRLAELARSILFERALKGSRDVYETIGEVTGYDGPPMSARSLVGVPDAGEFTFQYNLVANDGPQQRLRADFANGTLRSYRIRKADGTLPQCVFSAYVTAVSKSGAVNEKVAVSCTLKITGAVRYAARSDDAA